LLRFRRVGNVSTMKKWYVYFGLFAVYGNIAVADGFATAVRAYAARDYETALQILLPLAEQGHADAQFRLGMMFDNGLGVPEDPAQAEYWYNQACPLPAADPGPDETMVDGSTAQESETFSRP